MGIQINKQDYLKRFQASFTEPTIENLATLQCLHMRHIPFENLDVIRKRPIYLNTKQFYEKIVTNHRGGYCYEVNGLLHWLLVELGYDAHLSAATVKRPNGQYAKDDTHVVILVQLDKQYLVDVGFGDSSYYPVLMDGTESEDVSGTYKVDKRKENQFHLVRKEDSGWRTLYKFNTVIKDIVDFHEGCIFNQVSDQSTFTHKDIVTIARKDGRVTLSDQTLTTTTNGVQKKQEISPSEKEHILKEVFGITLLL